MRFLMAGSTGFLGTLLADHLRGEGHEVTGLTRGQAGPGQRTWDPYAAAPDQQLDALLVEESDVVVNLAGSPLLGNPHSEKWRTALRRSRVATTTVLARTIASSERKPAFLAGNGISIYGGHGDEVLTEDSPGDGDTLLASVSRDWQAAAEPAVEAGARVVFLRTSPVLDRRSEPLHLLSLLFKTGLGGPLGDGKQYFPVITARDWVAAVSFLAGSEIAGPVNLVIPEPPTNAEFTRELASQVSRPAFLRVPARIIKAAAAGLAPEVLGSVRARPAVLLEAGFTFSDPTIAEVLRTGLAA